jgi:hypothetical protein
VKGVLCVLWLLAAILTMCAPQAAAIDFYEIQIYTTQTEPYQHLTAELHSNSVTTATGSLAKQNLRPYEIHETLEASYGLLDHLELGQYLCTGKLSNGEYEYAGSRTKLHTGIGDPERWPVALGLNLELDYMRRQAEENPLSLEVRAILEKRFGPLWITGNFVFERPFSGPGTHRGVYFLPSGFVSYDLTRWLTPSIEYYADMGPIRSIPGAQLQQHFIVPTINLHLAPRLELNFGVGLGVTEASNGAFLKSIIGWTF